MEKDKAAIERAVISASAALGYDNVNKPNIIYSVHTFESMEGTFNQMIQTLKKERTKMPRTILYCQHQDNCAQLYLQMKLMLGEEHVEPLGAPDLPEFRLFDLQVQYMSL